ncbi:membrane protein CcdC involved in cytochrome C biogenesis [Chryseobacterium sp. H1D6B]|nr:membrane protein CcdC involved in cytochrome C biogenesis [Chryseobacterium sp. H1D6B]
MISFVFLEFELFIKFRIQMFYQYFKLSNEALNNNVIRLSLLKYTFDLSK